MDCDGARITRIEVYVVNNQANTQDVRNILAFTDIGEHPNYISSDLPIADLTDSPDIGINLMTGRIRIEKPINTWIISADIRFSRTERITGF